MEKKVRPWGGFARITKEERPLVIPLVKPAEPEPAPPPPAPTRRIREGVLRPDALPKIDRSRQELEAKERWVRQLSRLDEIPNTLPCAVCGKDATRDWFLLFTPEPRKICRSCRQSRNRCPRCYEVQKRPLVGDGFCRDCRNAAPCACCGKALPGEGLRLPFRKGAFCEDCMNGPRCHACEAPTRDGMTGFPWHLCSSCRAAPVSTEAERQALTARIQAFLRLLDPSFPFSNPEPVPFSPETPPPGGWPLAPLLLRPPLLLVPPVTGSRFLGGSLVVLLGMELFRGVRDPSRERIESLACWLRMSWYEKERDWVAVEAERAKGKAYAPFLSLLRMTTDDLAKTAATLRRSW